MIQPHESALLRDEGQFGHAASDMVRQQLRGRGITDPRVLDAMRRVPRHHFLHFTLWARAYDDAALPTLHNQTISQPFMVASMTQQLQVRSHHRVLEIGTGSGYQTMILSLMARKIFSVEREPELAGFATNVLEELGATNVVVHVGDGTLGYPDEAPYDRILVTAGAPEVPQALRDQLADGGRLVIPVGDRDSQTLTTITRDHGEYHEQKAFDCRFVPLVGEQGWSRAEK